MSLPAADYISVSAFSGCTSLESVEITSIWLLNDAVFSSTGTQALTVLMGLSAPYVGINIFNDLVTIKNVTVKVPVGATGYGTSPTDTTTDNWGNAFRGKGWDKRKNTYLTGTVNSNINLTIEYMD